MRQSYTKIKRRMRVIFKKKTQRLKQNDVYIADIQLACKTDLEIAVMDGFYSISHLPNNKKNMLMNVDS